jgi:hypothetical protein
MEDTLSEKLRIAAQGLELAESQQMHIVAHRLTREFMNMSLDSISVDELREMIKKSTAGISGAVAPFQTKQDPHENATPRKPESTALTEIDEEAYRANHIVNPMRGR